MGVESGLAAWVMAGAAVAGGVVAATANKGGSPKVSKPIQPVKTDAADSKRREVFSQMDKLRKQTLLAKRDRPEPALKKTVLGPGI